MEKREITLADIFLEILSKSQNKGTELMAERINFVPPMRIELISLL